MYETLRKQDPMCGDLYKRAIDAMGNTPLAEVDLVVAAHMMRELINRFPRVTGTIEMASGISSSDDVRRFAETWEAHDEAIASVRRGDVGAAIPVSVIDAADRLVENYRAGNVRSWQLRSVLVLGDADADTAPAVDEVARWAKMFERVRHPQGDTTGWLERESQTIAAAISVIENALEARLGSFFAVVDQLKEVLERANQTQVDQDGTTTWAAPVDDDVRDVVSRLGEVQHRRVFFGGLRNPRWLPEFITRKIFASAPTRRVDAEGRWIWTPWPEGEYLVAVASDEPKQVAATLNSVVAEDAAYEVPDLTLKAAVDMPAEHAATLVKLIVSFIDSPVDPRLGLNMVALVERLAAGGKLKDARRLAWALLRPRAGATRFTGTEVEAGIDRYWYGEATIRVLAALSTDPSLLAGLVHRLVEAEKIARPEGVGAEYDHSYIWRPSIGKRADRHDRDDVRNVLIDAIRDVALDRLESGENVERIVAVIERRGVPILDRIALHVLAERASDDAAVLPLALERLVREDLIESLTYRAEYAHLAGSVLPRLSDDDFGCWSDAFAAAPSVDANDAKRIGEHLQEGETVESAVAAYKERWRFEQLTNIGASALRGEPASELAELIERHGELGREAASRRAVRVHESDESPFTVEELLAKTPAEVVELLVVWEPVENGFGATKDGLGNVLRDVVAQRTLEYSALADEVLAMPRIYASRYLDGLREGTTQGGAIDWAALLPALRQLPIRSDEVRPEADPDEYGWGYPIRVATDVIGNGTRRGTAALPLDQLAAALEFVEMYVADPDPAPDLGTTTIDDDPHYLSGPLQDSLNKVRPQAVRALIKLAYYEHAQIQPANRPGAVTARALELLTERLAPARDDSSAIAAAFGEGYGRILTFAPDWVEQHRDQLLSGDAFGDVVATTALTTHTTSRPLVETLEPNISSIISRVGREEPVAIGWNTDRSPVENIGDHLVTMYLWGAYELDSPLVEQFFREASPLSRASVLGHLGWSFLGDDEIPEEILARARQLWEFRSQEVAVGRAEAVELKEFYWWIHSQKFPQDWWLPLLRKAATATDFDSRMYLGEPLAEAASTEPLLAVEVLDQLLRSAPAPMAGYNLIENSPEVIARALDSDDPEAQRLGRELMDRMGKLGNLDIRERVDGLRQSPSKNSDDS